MSRIAPIHFVVYRKTLLNAPYTFRELIDKGLSAESIRYTLLSIHYRQKLNFTFEKVETSQKAINRLRELKRRIGLINLEDGLEYKDESLKMVGSFLDVLSDDLNSNLPKIIRVGIEDKFPHEYGNQDTLQEFFGLKVQGDSMIEAGINEGDTVILKRTDVADNGKIVVALIDDHEAMLKRIRRKGKTVALESANRNYETKIFGPDRVKIQGVLVSLYRNF